MPTIDCPMKPNIFGNRIPTQEMPTSSTTTVHQAHSETASSIQRFEPVKICNFPRILPTNLQIEFDFDVIGQFKLAKREALEDGDLVPSILAERQLTIVAERVLSWLLESGAVHVRGFVFIRFNGGVELVIKRIGTDGRITVLISQDGDEIKILESGITENPELSALKKKLKD